MGPLSILVDNLIKTGTLTLWFHKIGSTFLINKNKSKQVQSFYFFRIHKIFLLHVCIILEPNFSDVSFSEVGSIFSRFYFFIKFQTNQADFKKYVSSFLN